jgi:putative transposase
LGLLTFGHEILADARSVLRYLWRAVDHEGEILGTAITGKRDKATALKLLKRVMKKYGRPLTVSSRTFRA